jgi:MFS family permease
MLVDNRGAPPAVGALTFAGFNLTMAIGRFSSGVVIQRYGRAPVLRAAGILACTGVVGLCLLGALAWGLGLSVVFPSAILVLTFLFLVVSFVSGIALRP